MTRKLLLLTVCLSVLGIGVWIVLELIDRQRQPTRSRLEAVEIGMTREQVHATVGFPPGVYPRGALYFLRLGVPLGHEQWLSERGDLHVFYGGDGCVVAKRVYDNFATPKRPWWQFWR